MAVITFTDERTISVQPRRAIKLMLIRRGTLKGTPEIMKYLKRVKDITFDTTIEPKRVEQGRLPYKDD